MPPVCRVDDKARCPRDSHGKDCCCHGVSGPATSGSPDVIVNGRPLVRVGDSGVHRRCCGANTWRATGGSSSVLVNGIPAVRLGDSTRHCGGKGRMVEASGDVIVG